MTDKKSGPTPVGGVLGNLLAAAKERQELPPPKPARRTSTVTPSGVIITPAQSKLLDVATEIASTPPDGQEIGRAHV